MESVYSWTDAQKRCENRGKSLVELSEDSLTQKILLYELYSQMQESINILPEHKVFLGMNYSFEVNQEHI